MRKNIDLETKLAIVEAGQACENTHSWHAILHAAGHTTEEIETFWSKYRDDLYWGYNMAGMYGREEVMSNWAGGLEGGARGLYPVFNEMYPETEGMDPLPLSEYSLHAIGTPIVAVGEDLKTARALYYSTGMLFRRISSSGKQMAVWMLERYGEDYVRFVLADNAHVNSDAYGSSYAFRPVVCLKSNVVLTWNAETSQYDLSTNISN